GLHVSPALQQPLRPRSVYRWLRRQLLLPLPFALLLLHIFSQGHCQLLPGASGWHANANLPVPVWPHVPPHSQHFRIDTDPVFQRKQGLPVSSSHSCRHPDRAAQPRAQLLRWATARAGEISGLKDRAAQPGPQLLGWAMATGWAGEDALISEVESPQTCQGLWQAFSLASPTRFFQLNPAFPCDSLLPDRPLQGNTVTKVGGKAGPGWVGVSFEA
ncbi:unnamed protein product, partial [Closterium sp. NIES-53]